MNSISASRRRFAMACALSALLLASGCQSVTTSQLENAPSLVRNGVTTMAEVRALYGEPDRRRIDPGGETWQFGGMDQRDAGDMAVDQAIGIGSGYIPVPYAGRAISGLRSLGRSSRKSEPSAVFEFDGEGILRDYAIDLP